jgi:glycerol-3-phosphate cytidylyltransferase-like family protein
MSSLPLVVVSGGFDDIRARDVRFLESAATFGPLTVLVWTDELLERQSGRAPRFPLIERLYLLNALRYVAHAISLDAHDDVDTLPATNDTRPLIWVDREGGAHDTRLAYCRHRGFDYHVVPAARTEGFPAPPPTPPVAGRKKVVVSGAFDWFHTGHVRFLGRPAATATSTPSSATTQTSAGSREQDIRSSAKTSGDTWWAP